MRFHHPSVTPPPFLAIVIWFAIWLLAPLAQAQASRPDTPRSDYPHDIRRIIERGELIVAMPNTDTPPFFFFKDGEMQGVDAELARGLAQALKVKIRFNRSAKSFNEVINVVARGEADVAICKLSRTLTRARTTLFSDPYLVLRHVLLLNRMRFAELSKGQEPASVIRQFRGSIGIIANSSYADFARQDFPLAKIVEFPGWQEVVSALKRGELDAAYRDEFEIKYLLKKDPRSSLLLRTVTLTDTEDSLGIAVAAGNYQLLGLTNLYLAQRPQKLNVEKILKLIDSPSYE